MGKIILIIIFGLLVITACDARADSSDQNEVGTLGPIPAVYAGKSNPFGSDASADGAQIFQANCGTCHGPQGHGDGPASGSLNPKPKNLAILQESAGDDYLFWWISEGKPGTAMLAWKDILTEEQIWQVVSFLRTLEG